MYLNQTIIKVLKLLRGTDVLVYADKMSSCLIFILGWVSFFFFPCLLVSLLGEHKHLPLNLGSENSLPQMPQCKAGSGGLSVNLCKEECFVMVIKAYAVIFSLLQILLQR